MESVNQCFEREVNSRHAGNFQRVIIISLMEWICSGFKEQTPVNMYNVFGKGMPATSPEVKERNSFPPVKLYFLCFIIIAAHLIAFRTEGQGVLRFLLLLLLGTFYFLPFYI